MILTAMALMAGAGSVAGQDTTLVPVAEAARVAWQGQDTKAILAPASNGVLVQLPGADPSSPVSQAQGAALLRQYLKGTAELETVVRAARVVGTGRGFVELTRRYQVDGTEEEREESVLLGYQSAPEGWRLTELRITRN
jgi:hypothetical protein